MHLTGVLISAFEHGVPEKNALPGLVEACHAEARASTGLFRGALVKKSLGRVAEPFQRTMLMRGKSCKGYIAGEGRAPEQQEWIIQPVATDIVFLLVDAFQ